MAIMAIYTANGFKTSDYDRVREAIGWENDPPAGALLHALGHDGFGLCSLEIWESEALFDDYVRDRFMPAFDRLGLPYPPAPRVMNLYKAFEQAGAQTVIARLQTSGRVHA
jgi:hypothetical protein